MQKIIICPKEEKERIIKHEKTLTNNKYLTIEEYRNNMFYKYDIDALYYLINKYNYKIDVSKVYLDSLYDIDINKEYHHKKLIFLQDLKKELIENNLLKYNYPFREMIKDKEIEIINYYELEKYLEKSLSKKIEIPNPSLNIKVYKYTSIEEEINATCIKIINLIKNNIPLNKIFLGNIDDDYIFLLKKIFSFYNIPLNIDLKESIYSTKVVKDYLLTNELDLEDISKNSINKKIISCLNKISNLEDNDIKETIKIDLLKNTYLSPKKYKDAINIIDFTKRTIEDDEYLFILGFNQDILPRMEKDISYITDNIKDEIDYYKTKEINKRRKEVIVYLLSRIKNLTISYKSRTPFNELYPSSLIKEYNLEVVEDNIDNYTYTNIYNKIRLCEMKDLYDLYREKNDYLDTLNSKYIIPYKTYNNNFTGIDNALYRSFLKSLTLSYSSLNTYNECKFKFYIKNILKLEEYTPTFQAQLGTFYHHILSLYKKDNFDIEKEIKEYLSTQELSTKEKIFLIKIKEDLKELIKIINKQNLLTGFNNELYEEKINIKLSDTPHIEFIGFIDKIMYYKKLEDTYFSIIDYKTGTVDTHIEPLKYGLNMQLAIYLYLIKYSNLFKKPIFTGIYYQNIMFPYPTWTKNIEEEKEKRYYLNGYSTDNTNILEIFDSTYEDSNLIKSMKYKDNKFSYYSKTIDDDTINKLVDYVERLINTNKDEILKGDFIVNPKIYDKKNVSCTFCSFKDLCFKKEKDEVYLEKVDDLSFLGGEE